MSGQIVLNPDFPHSSNYPMMWVSDDEHDDDYWEKLHEAEERKWREEDLKRPKTCDEYCSYASHCYRKDLQTVDNNPDKCIERIKLEDYEWDAQCGNDYEPDDYECDESEEE